MTAASQSKGARKCKVTEEVWPREVRQGSAVVKIYRQSSRNPPLYCVVHYLDGRRQRRNFTDLRAAERECSRVLSLLSRADHVVLKVGAEDWRLYSLALDALQGLGTPIDVACREYAAAKKILGDVPLVTAAEGFSARMATAPATCTVPELVEQFLDAKANAGLKKRALEDYRSRLRRFSRAFRCSVASLSTKVLQEFLDSLRVGNRTRRNFKTCLVTLFEFARSRGYLDRERSTEAEHLDNIQVQPSEIGIFEPGEVEKLLDSAGERLVPYLAIRAFAGIRDAEIRRMSWDNVRFAERLIEVPAQAAKRTRGKSYRLRRLITMTPNLEKWLIPYRERKGLICQFYNPERAARKLARAVGIGWVHNGLRHGFGSYRVAQTRNYPEVAYEMGNSVEVIKRCYDQVVSTSEAERYFKILPKVVDENT
jgi:integrase